PAGEIQSDDAAALHSVINVLIIRRTTPDDSIQTRVEGVLLARRQGKWPNFPHDCALAIGIESGGGAVLHTEDEDAFSTRQIAKDGRVADVLIRPVFFRAVVGALVTVAAAHECVARLRLIVPEHLAAIQIEGDYRISGVRRGISLAVAGSGV